MHSGRVPQQFVTFTYLDPAARSFFVDWDAEADVTIAALNQELAIGTDWEPAMRTIDTLIDKSPEFVQRRRDYPIGIPAGRTIKVNHPQLGALEFYNHRLIMLQLERQPLLLIRTPVPGTGTAQALASIPLPPQSSPR